MSLKSFIRNLTIGEYQIIYRHRQGGSLLESLVTGGTPLHYSSLKPSRRYWYADPLPYKIGGVTYLFMEMFDYSTGKGVIGVSEFDSRGVLSNPRVIIEEPFHMSFPHVFEYNGEIYMLPETSAADELRFYKMGDTPYEWSLYKSYKDVGKLVDTITYIMGDEIYLWTTELLEDVVTTVPRMFRLKDGIGGELEDISHIIVSRDPSMKCRNAGAFVAVDGRLYRISQESIPGEYGVNLVFNEVLSFTDTCYEERALGASYVDDIICSKLPVIEKKKGIHTYSLTEDYEILDLMMGKVSYKRWFPYRK